MAKKIKRIPVTKASYLRQASAQRPSMTTSTMGQGQMANTAKAKTGKIDKDKIRNASTGVPGMRQASFGVGDVWHTSGQSYNSAYRSSYANSGNSAGAFGDVPLYFALMNENNGGILYWPVNLKEKYSWYRYFYRTDPFVGQAVDLHIELPLSKVMLKMPEMKDRKRRDRIEKKYQHMMSELKIFEKLQSILFEYLLIGNCFPGNHRVHTIDGMLPISEVRKGDYVLTHKGRYREVIATTRRKTFEKLVSIGLSKYGALNFTPTIEHPILLLKDGREVFVNAGEVREGDFVSLWHNDYDIDKEQIEILDDLKDILSVKYDDFVIKSDNNVIDVDVKYKTRTRVSSTRNEIKDKLFEFLCNLKSEYRTNYDKLGEKLNITNWKKLRTISSELRNKGYIDYKVIRSGGGGCEVVFQPLKNKKYDEPCREWKNKYSTKITKFNVNESFLYLLGYWLGDGWLWKYKRPNSHSYNALDIIFEKDGVCNDYCYDVAKKVFGEDNVEFCVGSYCNDNMEHIIVKDVLLCEWWGYNFGANCDTKKIPQWVMNLPKEKLIWLLRGVIDSDGCVSGNTVSITSKNETLSQQLFRIGLKCEIPFNFGSFERKSTLPKGETIMQRGYSLTITNNDIVEYLVDGSVKADNFISSCKKEKNIHYKQVDNRFYYRVNNISEKIHNGYVYNIEVDEDNTYCVENINTHNCYIFMEWDENKKQWKKMIILPPEEVNVFRYPFSEHSRIEYNPELFMEIITKIKDRGTYKKIKNKKQLKPFLEEEEMKAIEHIPVDLINHIIENEAIVMDTDPYTGDKDMVGSFVYHLARRKSEYEDLGVSILERCLVPLLMKEHYKYTQLSLASRNMTPRNKISAPGITPEDLDDLREQVDLSMLDPDYSIVTNYDWSWEQIGSDQRLMDLQREYETIENQLFAGLGVTRELLTGEGQYSGGRITVEIMNTRYMLMREVLKNMIEENIFKPVAEVNGFYDVDKDGYKTYYYPTMSFNRLTIRDNAEVFDSLFQLYQKGSIPIDTILDLFNIDSNEVHEKLVEDQFTVKDAVYNDMMRSIYGDVASGVVENSDIVKRMVDSMSGPDNKNLTYQQPQEEGMGGGDDYSESGDDYSELGDDEIDEMAENTANAIQDSIPEDATEEDIEDALDGLRGDSDEEETEEAPLEDESSEEDMTEEQSDEEKEDDALNEMAEQVADGIQEALPNDATKEDIDNALEKLKDNSIDEDDENEDEIDAFADELAEELEETIPDDATKEDIEKAVDNLKK